MKRKSLLAPFLLFAASFCLTSCGSSTQEDVIYLRILNSEDYIGEGETPSFWNDSEDTYEGTLEAFEAYEKEVNHKNVHIVYETFDTNETMLSSLQTGKSTYDLIVPSEYTVQKMMASGMLEPFEKEKVPNYYRYCPSYLLEMMENITSSNGDDSGQEYPVADYMCGYMWGTLGVLYNPALVSEKKGISEDEIKWDMNDWTSLWDEKYNLMMSVKDSMRDTYSVGIMKLFDEEIKNNIESSGDFDENYELLEGHYDDAIENYYPKMYEIFNRSDEETVSKVKTILLELKQNVYGFEVDSGKDDIVKGLIGMNLAWSGDAVYAMDRGENEADQTIYYSVPKTGGNIWFDGWVMPKSDSLNKEEAEEFVDFVSNPAIASCNMDSTGYTSFIAGNYVLDLVRDWYDPRSYEMYQYDDSSSDWEEWDFAYDENGERVYVEGMEGSTYEYAMVDGEKMSWDEYQKENELDWTIRNLTYMFEGTLDEDPELEGDITLPENNPYLFYSDELEAIEDPYSENGNSILVGRQFYAQYPDNDMIPKLASMRDYGNNNKYVLEMWQDVKSNNLPIWAVITFAIILGAAAAAISVSLVAKIRLKRVRVARRKEVTEALKKEEASKVKK